MKLDVAWILSKDNSPDSIFVDNVLSILQISRNVFVVILLNLGQQHFLLLLFDMEIRKSLHI